MSGFFGGGPSTSNISFAANSCQSLADTWLWPGNELEQAAQILEAYQPIRLPPGRTGVLSRLRVTAQQPPVTQKSTFTVRKRSPGGAGVFADTTLTVDLNAGSSIVSDDVNSVSIVDGDEISIRCHPTAGQTQGPATYVMGVLLLTIQ